MKRIESLCNRRRFLQGVALGIAAYTTPGLFAEELVRTPPQGEGPFYPDKLPLDTDNDLLIINNSITPAVGEITHLSGRILDARGDPIRDALVEIWQVDSNGVYIHSKSPNPSKRDVNFQGFGRFLTASSGEYRFRTVKPVMYGQGSVQRAPHIHFKVRIKGRGEFITQCYIKGEPKNESDFAFKRLMTPKDRDALLVAFTPIKGSRIGELAAKFDIVLGFTPEG